MYHVISFIVIIVLVSDVELLHNCKLFYQKTICRHVVVKIFCKVANVDCGRIQSRRLGKVVGGQEAREGEFPWMVSITRRGGHFCGGSILTDRHILTAGHCICR